MASQDAARGILDNSTVRSLVAGPMGSKVETLNRPSEMNSLTTPSIFSDGFGQQS